jgi:hypothetical protein
MAFKINFYTRKMFIQFKISVACLWAWWKSEMFTMLIFFIRGKIQLKCDMLSPLVEKRPFVPSLWEQMSPFWTKPGPMGGTGPGLWYKPGLKAHRQAVSGRGRLCQGLDAFSPGLYHKPGPKAHPLVPVWITNRDKVPICLYNLAPAQAIHQTRVREQNFIINLITMNCIEFHSYIYIDLLFLI